MESLGNPARIPSIIVRLTLRALRMFAQSFSFSVPRLAFTARTFALVTPQPLRMAPSTAASSVVSER